MEPVARSSPDDAAAPGPVDIDLYCLKCGYNLRGLSGETLRCPECGFKNPIGDVTLPAPLITAQLRRMETAPAVCVGMVLLFLPFAAVLAVVLIDSPRTDVSMVACLMMVVGAAAGGWTTSVLRFRTHCQAKLGWVGVLVRYHVCGLALSGMVLVVVMGGVAALDSALGSWRGGRTVLYAVALLFLLAAAVVIIGVVAVRLHRWLRASLEPLQREVAVTIARQRARQHLASGRRMKGLG